MTNTQSRVAFDVDKARGTATIYLVDDPESYRGRTVTFLSNHQHIAKALSRFVQIIAILNLGFLAGTAVTFAGALVGTPWQLFGATLGIAIFLTVFTRLWVRPIAFIVFDAANVKLRREGKPELEEDFDR